MSEEIIRNILLQHGRLSAEVDELDGDSDLYNAGLTSLATGMVNASTRGQI